MKTATVVVLLLFAFTTKSCFFGVANAEDKPVLDIEGDELRTGEEYFVVSPLLGPGGGGLALGRTNDQKCPEVVVQRQFYGDDGIPVIISNLKAIDDVVRENKTWNIEFVPTRDRLCPTSTVWKVDDSGEGWLTTGGVKGNEGPSGTTSWFTIASYNNFGYKFLFCPFPNFCYDIGRYLVDGQIRLRTGDQGWPFLFKKASSKIKQVVNAKQ